MRHSSSVRRPARAWRRFADWLPLVNRRTLGDDLFAGITSAIIVVPQGVAFAILAGLPPQYGLYTAIVPVIIAALFGSSHHLLSGPTTPLSLLVVTAVAPLAQPGTTDYIALAITLSFLTGLYQIALALARMGNLVHFISHSVVIGFTSGAAVLIITKQMGNALGVTLPPGESFIHTWGSVAGVLEQANPYAVGITVLTILVSVLINRLRPRWPHLLIAMIAGSLVALAVGGEQRGLDLVGAIPSELPPLSLPDLSASNVQALMSSAAVVALLGLVEAVSIARSVAAKSHQHLDGNREFMGQGLSNVVGSFFSCYPSSGSFIRTSVNYRSGAKTPLAAIFSAVAVVLVLMLASPLTAYLPMAALAGILLLVGWKLIDFRHIRVIFRTSKQESAVLIVTALATLFVGLEFGVYVGVILSLILHLNRISHPTITCTVPGMADEKRRLVKAETAQQCPQLRIVRVDGSFFFGSVGHIEEALRRFDERQPEQKHLLLVCNAVNFIDMAGAEFLLRENLRRRGRGGDLYLSNVKPGVMELLERGGYLEQLGRDHIFKSKSEAIANIFCRLAPEICEQCTARVFKECPVETERSAPSGFQ